MAAGRARRVDRGTLYHKEKEGLEVGGNNAVQNNLSIPYLPRLSVVTCESDSQTTDQEETFEKYRSTPTTYEVIY